MTARQPLRAYITLVDGEHRIHLNAMPNDLKELYNAVERAEGGYPYWFGWGTVGSRRVLHVPESEGSSLMRSLGRTASTGFGMAGEARSRIRKAREDHLLAHPRCPHRDDVWP